MTRFGGAEAGWPLGAALVFLVVGQRLRAVRLRKTLNEALHELRRPLQSLALMATGPVGAAGPRLPGTVHLALSALARIDAEINGGERRRPLGPVPGRALVEAAVGRWRSRASLAGAKIELRWRAGLPLLRGDRAELAQALDNLIVNAIEHGGPMITVDASTRRGRLHIAVADSGTANRPPSRRESPSEAIARLTGRRRHGHGLAVVRRVAAAHGGRFVFDRTERGALAVLELPLGAERHGRVA